MSNDNVETIASVNNPVTLIEDRNGNVIGNSQAMAREILTLRAQVQRLTTQETNQKSALPPENHLTDKLTPGTF